MIWQQLDKDGELDKAELARALKAQVMSRKLSKLICLHTSEWGADYSSLEVEVAAFFDKHIEEADKKVKKDLEDKKTAALEALKPKVENLDFWSKVKVASNKPEGIPSFGNDVSSDAQTPSYMAWGEPQAEETPTVPFPTSPKVYHFHPIAFVEQMRMMGVRLFFPLGKMPLNHSRGYKKSSYKDYDYTNMANRAAPFGKPRSTTRLHAGCDLYGDPGDPIFAIDDGVVNSVSSYYNDTWQVTIVHEFEIKKGHKVIARYGEVNKNNILVSVGDKVTKGQKIAEIGLLIPYVEQPKGEKRGMLHFEMYTGEASGRIKQNIEYNDMLYSDSDDEKFTCKSDYQIMHKFQRRKDLINPLYYLNEMIETL